MQFQVDCFVGRIPHAQSKRWTVVNYGSQKPLACCTFPAHKGRQANRILEHQLLGFVRLVIALQQTGIVAPQHEASWQGSTRAVMRDRQPVHSLPRGLDSLVAGTKKVSGRE